MDRQQILEGDMTDGLTISQTNIKPYRVRCQVPLEFLLGAARRAA